MREGYLDLINQSKYKNIMIYEKEKELTELQHRYRIARETLANDEYANNLQALQLQKKISQLTQKQKELIEETNGTLNPEQIKYCRM